MLRELTTRVFQQACWTLDRATHGTVNELYTVAEISDILESWRNGEGQATGKDIPQLNTDQLVEAFVLGSYGVKGLKPCASCDVCGRLYHDGYATDCNYCCSISCAVDAGLDLDDLETVNSSINL